MTTVQEASSLFGSSESNSDLFDSSVGNDGHDNDQRSTNQSTDGDVHASSDVDALFAAVPGDDFLNLSSWSSPNTPQDYGYNQSNYPSSAKSGDSDLKSPFKSPPGWFDQNEQWYAYDQAGVQDSTQASYYNTQGYSSGSQMPQQYQHPEHVPAYSPQNYTPSTQSHYSSPPVQPISSTTTPQYASRNGSSASYDRYKPNYTPSTAYTPAANTASSSHDVHNSQISQPSAPQSYSAYSYPANDKYQATSAYAAPPVQASVVPPTQPVVTAAAYRPKAVNAYDPPLPPPKPKRAQSSWQRSQSPATVYNQSYGVQNSPGLNASAVLPPDSRSGSNTYHPTSANASSSTSPRKPVDGLPNGNYDYSRWMSNYTPPIEAQEHRNEARAPSQPSSSPKLSAFVQPPSATEESFPEDPEDPEGGGMDFTAGKDRSLNSSMNVSWTSESGTVTPDTVRKSFFAQSDGAPPVDESTSPPVSELISADQYHSYASAPSVFPPLPVHKDSQPVHDYQPYSSINPVRTTSPASIHSQSSQHEPRKLSNDLYAPSNVKPVAHDPYSPPNRMRSTSNGSVLSMNSTQVDPYAPSRHLRQQSNESSEFGHYTSRYNYPERPPSTMSTLSDKFGSQTISASSTYSAYAPSPSLLATNDPLGRAAARIPVFSFGFGGKVVTCFHGASLLNTGFDVALSSRQSRDVRVHSLQKMIPKSVLGDTTTPYPGPLFSDPGSPTAGLVRPGMSAQTKSKKARIIKYLEERIEDLSRGFAYLNTDHVDYGRTEGKLVLVKLLKLLVENDGRLSGTPELDVSVRAALFPHLANSIDTGPEQFSTPADGLSGTLAPTEPPLAINTLKPSHLEKIRDFLIRGERRKAYHYALDEKLWAHAMVIASSINKEAWQEVTNEFIRTELGIQERKGETARASQLKPGGPAQPSVPNGYEGLRAAYSLYAGQGASSVKALLPAKPLVKIGEGSQLLPPTPMNFLTPVTPNFSGQATATIPTEILGKWPETVAMMISSPISPDTSSALTALGDYLTSNHWIEAGHACYLLSPQTSPLGGVGTPSSRVVLFGSASPHIALNLGKDPDPIVFTEIVEFALSLTAAPKGQEPFAGLQYLQPYRLIHAYSLAEMGQVQLAARYCEAITAALSRSSLYFTPTFLEQLNGLSNRLIAAPSLDKNSSWIGGKMTRPSLDKIGGWLEGRFTKFIAGEGDHTLEQEEEDQPSQLRSSQGPFSHYSAISSAGHSTDPSPYSSTTNLVSAAGSQPPPARSGSAMALRTSTASPHLHINRSSSAMDHVRPGDRSSPVHRMASGNASSNGGTHRSVYANGGHAQGTSSGLTTVENSPTSHPHNGDKSNSPWWGSSSNDSLNSQTPTVANFMRVPENESESSDTSGFISLMDNSPMLHSAPSSHANTPAPLKEVDEEEEDLGLGNNSGRSKQATPSNEGNGSAVPAAKTEEPEKESDARPESKSSNTGSWLSKWWKKDSTPGPIRANLGEETAFYYDKELKRWVNKKAGGEQSKPAAPPPPPNRSQTASPGRSASYGVSSPSLPPGPPPTRPASAAAVDLTSPPRKNVPRVRSNLVPEEVVSPTLPTPSNSAFHGAEAPVPPGRPRSQASKKPVRSRYVDVFQQSTPPPPEGSNL